MTKRKHHHNQAKKKSLLKTNNDTQPFIEHVYELRRRLFYVAVSVIGVALIAYGFQQQLTDILLAPAHGQRFIYTSVGGGLDFLFRVCMYTGIACSIPVIFYQLLRYVEPLINDGSVRFIRIGSAVSGLLALAGIAFGYFIGLPAVLHFLFHQFTTAQIQPLVTIQSYIAFVTVYMLGSALLFQVPLIILFINRITPLKPSKLFHYERWVILGAFVASGLMNPTLNVFSQLLVAGPIILMYQVGIVIIWRLNRTRRQPKKLQNLLARDSEIQTTRLTQARATQPVTAKPAMASPDRAAQKPAPLTATRVVPPQHRTVQSRTRWVDIRPNYRPLSHPEQPLSSP